MVLGRIVLGFFPNPLATMAFYSSICPAKMFPKLPEINNVSGVIEVFFPGFFFNPLGLVSSFY